MRTTIHWSSAGLAALISAAKAVTQETGGSHGLSMARKAGDVAQRLCEDLAASFKPQGLVINNTFSQYFAEGLNPTPQNLTDLYPPGTIPASVNVSSILPTLGDFNITEDYGYGKSSTRAAKNGPTGGLPPFCRFGAFITTSQVTNVLAEVWMPLESDPNIPLATDLPASKVTGQLLPTPPSNPKTSNPSGVTNKDSPKTPANKDDANKPPVRSRDLEKRQRKNLMTKRRTENQGGDDVLGHSDCWNGRIMVSGNGGQRGFVPFEEMKQMVSRYRFVAAGSNWGHFSGSNDVAWVNGTQFEETLRDYGSRANHLTLQLAQQVTEAYYGPGIGIRSKRTGHYQAYYSGSSTGGARGYNAITTYPQDFDGILAGSPANNFMNMNVGQIHTASLANANVTGKGAFDQGILFGPVKDIVTRQCDLLDKVADGIISDPFDCRPDITQEILCGGTGKYSSSNKTCLTADQITNYNKLITEDTIIDGKFIYPHYLPGLEDSASSFKPTNAKASGWTQLVTLQKPKLDAKFDPFKDIRAADVEKGNAADPGGANANSVNWHDFISTGGKAIIYHGTYDLVVSPLNTIGFFESMIKANGGIAAAHAIKFYLVPGMRHSREGPGAWHFGGASQLGPGSRPLVYDTNHDVILALVAWAEGGQEPHTQIAAAYNAKEAPAEGADDGGKTKPSDDKLPIVDVEQRYSYGVKFTRPLCPWPEKALFLGGDAAGVDGFRAFKCA